MQLKNVIMNVITDFCFLSRKRTFCVCLDSMPKPTWELIGYSCNFNQVKMFLMTTACEPVLFRW